MNELKVSNTDSNEVNKIETEQEKVKEEEIEEEEEEEEKQPPIRTRDKVATEIAESERSYLKTLDELCILYLKPLRAAIENGAPIIKSDEIQTIFGNVEQIIGINTVNPLPFFHNSPFTITHFYIKHN